MISEPIACPLRSRNCPFALSANNACARAVTTSGYNTPSRTVVTTVIRIAIRTFRLAFIEFRVFRVFRGYASSAASSEPQCRDDDVDHLDADKRRDDAAD